MAEKWDIDVGALAKQLGWSTPDAKSWLENQGFGPKTTEAQFTKAEKGAPAASEALNNQGFVPGALKTLGQAEGGTIETLLGPLIKKFTTGFTGGGQAQPTEAATKPKKESAKLPSPQQATVSPFTQLAQALAQEYLGQVQQLESLTSGAQTPGLEAEAQGGAEAALKGLGVGGAAQQFVANQPAVPLSGNVAHAQQALGNAQSAGALGMAGAIGNAGAAETAGLEAAPYSTLLNELVNETAYRAASPTYGASAFGATTSNTPPWLQSVLKAVGLNVPSPGGTGLATPGLPTPAKAGTGGTSKSSVPGSSGVTGGP